MTQNKINKAYSALTRLGEIPLPVTTARSIYNMAKKAEEYFLFAVQEEKKYIAEFGGKENPDGTFSFETAELFGKFQEKLAELGESEVVWDFKPVSIRDDEMRGRSISPADIYNLEGFVTFDS